MTQFKLLITNTCRHLTYSFVELYQIALPGGSMSPQRIWLTFSLLFLFSGLSAAVILAHPTSHLPGVPYIVTTTADSNDGLCDDHCSLREAITAANASPTADTITFAPPSPAQLPYPVASYPPSPIP